jgi:dTDP-4-amino-4,6-dideoxygalactose transaminase
MQAAVLHAKLEEVDKYNNLRKVVAEKYNKALAGLPVKTLPEKYVCLSSWHLYPVQIESVETRQRLMDHLRSKEIGCTPFYEKTLSQEPALKEFVGEDELAKNFAGKTLCLPIHPFLKDEEINEVVGVLKEFFS